MLRQIAANRSQTLLMVAGVALGVAVVVAVDIANDSASRAFQLSTEAIAGRATHEISGGPTGVPVEVYRQLRRSGRRDAAPVIQRLVVVEGQPLTLLGIDPFADAQFRGYTAVAAAAASLDALLTVPGAAILAAATADSLGLAVGDDFEVVVGGISKRLVLVDLAEAADARTERAVRGILLTDIASAQELTGRPQRVDRIDLILDDAAAAQLAGETLGRGLRLDPVGTASGPAREMIDAFRTNLLALSLLALIVGLFLIFNTMTFSVVRRRAGIGTLRALGMTAREVFRQICIEASAIGLVGTGLGLLLGVALGRGAVDLVLTTINDIFFPLTFRDDSLPLLSLAKGAALGVGATVVAALPAAREAAASAPRSAMMRSSAEHSATRLVAAASRIALLLLLGGLVLFALPTRSLVVGFAGLFAATLGIAFLTPLATQGLMSALIAPLRSLAGSLGAAAPRDVSRSLSRTATAVAALMLAISVAIGLQLMIGSFRSTVAVWLERTLTGDVYISAPSVGGTAATDPLAPGVRPALEQLAGVRSVDFVRSTTVRTDLGPIRVAASSRPVYRGQRLYHSLAVPVIELSAALRAGAVLASEPLMNRLGIEVGSLIAIDGRDGPHRAEVVGIYYDYASSQGTLMLDMDFYQRLSGDTQITGAALHLEDPGAAAEMSLQVARALAPQQALDVRPNRALRAEVFAVFDQAFAITGALVILATLVAALGVLSALLAVQLERGRDFGILRAVGLTARQSARQVVGETMLLGAAAGLLAIPTGTALAYLLIHVINKRAFGWTLQMTFDTEPYLSAMGLALGSALLAALLPARRIAARSPVELLR